MPGFLPVSPETSVGQALLKLPSSESHIHPSNLESFWTYFAYKRSNLVSIPSSGKIFLSFQGGPALPYNLPCRCACLLRVPGTDASASVWAFVPLSCVIAPSYPPCSKILFFFFFFLSGLAVKWLFVLCTIRRLVL